MAKERINEDGERERQCAKCLEWWPADTEFFYSTGRKARPKLHSYCKACYLEWKAARRAICRVTG